MFINPQLKPSAATLSTLLTASGETVVSSLVVCNLSAVATTFRIAIRPLGASISDEMYIYYDAPINGNDTFVATIGVTLKNTDIVSVYATLATVSFGLFGSVE